MTSEKNKSVCERPIGKAMAIITKSYWGALSKKLEHLGVDRHFSALVAINNASEKCTQQYLSDTLKVDKVGMVRIMDYLMDKGMITRVVNPNDRREHLIQLTPKAKKVMPAVHEGIKEMNNIALRGLTKKEVEQFKEFVEKVEVNLGKLPVNAVDIKIKK